MTYEDNDPLVLAGYSEGDWQTVSVPEAVGGNLTWTDVPGAELVLYFEGSAIEILHSRGPEGGDFHISLDDMTWPPFNGYAEQYLYGTSIQQFNISPGVHQLVMTNGDGALWIEAIRVQDGALLPAIQWTAYPSNDPDVLYTGMWASMPSADVTQESVMYSFTGERSLSVRFQGTGIRVIYSREYQSGLNLQARVDHAATQSVSHPVPSENSQHALVFDTLPYDEHTLHITIAAGTLWVERIDIQGTLLPAEAPLESSASRSAPLALESTLPLVFTEVSTVEELVSAVEAANAAINEHHVILLTPGTYTFDGSSSMWVEAALIVAAYKTVTFIGMGGIDPETGDSLLPADHPASQSWPWATLAMNPADSLNLLDTQVGSTVRLYNIQLRGGGGDPTLRYAGGGIRNSGDLFLYNSRLEDNQANVSAGAILNFANLTTINTALSDNYAVYGSAVLKWNSASLASYCSTYEGNAAYIGALNLETGGSVDLRHSNFIGNEAFDEEFDTFADVYSADPVTLPNNYWSGSVGESVNEHVNRSPQSPTRILYGSFSNEGEPCYVPPPPTLCPTSTLEMQAFGATSSESFLNPVCQPPQYCSLVVNVPSLNLRAEPNSDSDILTVLPQGEKLRVIPTDEAPEIPVYQKDWWHVEFDENVEGFVYEGNNPASPYVVYDPETQTDCTNMLAERQATFVVLYDFLKGHIFSLVYQPNLATDELAEFEEFRAKYLDDGLEEDTMPPLISDTNWENTFTQYSDQEFLDLVLDIAGNVIPIYGSWNLTQVENLIRIFTEVDNLVSNAELDGVAFVAMGSEAEEWGLPQVMPHYFGTYQVGTGDANFPVLVFNTDGTFAADTVYERWMIHELGHHYDFSVLGPPLFSLTISEVWGWGSDGTTYPTDDLNPVNAPSLDLDPHGYGFSSSYPTLSIRQQIWEDFAEVFTAAIYYFEAGGDQQGLDRLNEINRIWNPDDLFVPNAVRRCTVETLFEVEWPYHLDETADDYYPTACDEVDATQEYSQ